MRTQQTSPDHKLNFNQKWKIVATLLAFCTIVASLYAENHNSSQSATPGLRLNQYTLTGTPIPLSGIADNASGLTFNTDTGTLFAIINNPEQLVELNTSGKVLRTITLEGLAYIGNQQFAIIEERKRAIVLISIQTDTQTIKLKKQRSLSLPPPNSNFNNNGFEGLTIDIKTGRLFIVNEKRPRQLIQIDGFASNEPNISVSNLLDLENKPMGNRDFSGIYYDQQFNRLILLSDESRQLVEVGMDGLVSSQLKLQTGHAGLTNSIPQAEGVTLDNDGTLYILSEPNLLYKFHFSG